MRVAIGSVTFYGAGQLDVVCYFYRDCRFKIPGSTNTVKSDRALVVKLDPGRECGELGEDEEQYEIPLDLVPKAGVQHLQTWETQDALSEPMLGGEWYYHTWLPEKHW